MPAEHISGTYRDLQVVGNSSNSNIESYSLPVLRNEDDEENIVESVVEIEGIADTISSREHPSHDGESRFEVNLTILGSELFTEEYQGFPYGSNPRLPVLCPTYTDIYETVVDEDNFLNFIAFNTGIDVFANNVIVDGQKITITFNGKRDGIANGGLTYSVLQYAYSQGLLPEDLRVSVRIWSKKGQSNLELTTLAEKRNSHRPLARIDRLNTMGAFSHMKQQLDEAFAERIIWHTGDQDVDQEGNISVEKLCRDINSFRIKASGADDEKHPTMNPLEDGQIESIFETMVLKGTITSPNFSWELMFEAVGGESQ